MLIKRIYDGSDVCSKWGVVIKRTKKIGQQKKADRTQAGQFKIENGPRKDPI